MKLNLPYYNLIITAKPEVEIWLGDDLGHFVQKEIGKMDTSLLPGEYSVQFGLKSKKHSITLTESGLEIDQRELEPPVVKFDENDKILNFDEIFKGIEVHERKYDSFREAKVWINEEDAMYISDKGLMYGEMELRQFLFDDGCEWRFFDTDNTIRKKGRKSFVIDRDSSIWSKNS